MCTLAIGIGPQEILIILLILLFLFGAKKLPELSRSMGSSINQFKKGLREGKEALGEGTVEERTTEENRR